MKGMHVKKIGAVAAGALMLGTALAGAVTATFDTTGLDKSYFYDSDYNPIVQIVVGDKGMTSDVIGAGNIAATIGNMAYKTASVTAGGGTASAAGEVILAAVAAGAAGDFVQDENPSPEAGRCESGCYEYYCDAFWDDTSNGGIYFDDEDQPGGDSWYEQGEFLQYSMACGVQTTEAAILKTGEYNNLHCLFCLTLCEEALENPSHEFEERIRINGTNIRYYEYGLDDEDAEELRMHIEDESIMYYLDTGYIPLTDVTDAGEDHIDFEWRGKFLLFGEEYYVKEVKGDDELHLAKGAEVPDVTSEGFTTEYNGYKFKIDHLIYSDAYEVAGLVIDVQKPDGTTVQTQISKRSNGMVDNFEIAGIWAEESDSVSTASIIVYDTDTNIVLEDNKDLQMGSETLDDWRVEFIRVVWDGDWVYDTGDIDPRDDLNMDISEYDDAGHDESNVVLLKAIIVTYTDDVELSVGESFNFPTTFAIIFDGFRDDDYLECEVSGGEEAIELETDDEYKVLISFTDDRNNRRNDVGIHEGPYKEGDYFIAGGELWEFVDAEEEDDYVTLTFKKVFAGGKQDHDVYAQTCSSWDHNEAAYCCEGYPDPMPGADIILTTWAFNGQDDDEDEELDTDEEPTITDTYTAMLGDVFPGTHGTLYYEGGNLWLDGSCVYDHLALDNGYYGDCRIALASTVMGHLDKFQEDGNNMELEIWDEYCDEEDYDLNDDGNDDDILIWFWNEDYEEVMIDFYDRDYDSDVDDEYSHSLAVYDEGCYDTDIALEISDDEDTTMWLLDGGDEFNVNYGGDNEITGVMIKHPKKSCDMTYFVGTSEELTEITVSVTEADVGKEKMVGCCSVLVKEFTVVGAVEEGEAVTCTTVNMIGNLVVGEAAADLEGNLVVVGGPVVNSLSTVTADEIAAATNRYIVKKDMNRLIVAGYDADDTNKAADKLIDWLKTNIH
jgi:hypothetical protein